MLAYPCRFEPASRWDPEDVGFVVTCRDVPEVTAQGDSMEEAVAMVADALAVTLSDRRGPGDWPRPSPPEPGEVVVALPPLLAAKVALWASMNEAGISKARIGWRFTPAAAAYNLIRLPKAARSGGLTAGAPTEAGPTARAGRRHRLSARPEVTGRRVFPRPARWPARAVRSS